jgi:hypothetical protein
VVREQDSPLVEEDPHGDRLPQLLSGWLGSLTDRYRAVADLAFAETRLAITTFMLMIFVSVLAAGALLFAWALLIYAVGQIPIAMGFSRVGAALILVAAHVLLAWLLWRYANSLGGNMNFPETRRVLRATAESTEEAKDDGRKTED